MANLTVGGNQATFQSGNLQVIPFNDVGVNDQEWTTLELKIAAMQGQISTTQSIFIDNGGNDHIILVQELVTQFRFTVAPRYSGWFPLVMPGNPVVQLRMVPANASYASVSGIISCAFSNVPIVDTPTAQNAWGYVNIGDKPKPAYGPQQLISAFMIPVAGGITDIYAGDTAKSLAYYLSFLSVTVLNIGAAVNSSTIYVQDSFSGERFYYGFLVNGSPTGVFDSKVLNNVNFTAADPSSKLQIFTSAAAANSRVLVSAGVGRTKFWG